MRIDRISRRAWLQGAGGALLAVPFLASLAPRGAKAQSKPPRRFVFVGGRFGRDITRWYPSAEPTMSSEGVTYAKLADSGTTISPILAESFNPIREKMSLLRGLDGLQIAGDGHTPSFALTASGEVNGQVGFGYSVDSVIGESRKIYPNHPVVDVVRSCPSPKKEFLLFSYSSASGVAQRLPFDYDPFTTYTKLFDPVYAQQRSAFGKRQSPVANAVMEDLRKTLGSGRISKDDKLKLEAHLALLSDVEAGLGVSAPACPNVGAPAAMDSAEALHETAMKLEIAALSCGLTRVVVHAVIHHDSEVIPNTPEAHSAAHSGRSKREESGRDPVDQWVMNRWTMERVSTYISQLAATPDGETNLLDNTVFLYGNVEARGFHSFYDLPVILAGSPDLFRLGYYVDFRPKPLVTLNPSLQLYGGRPYNQVLVTVLKAMGLSEADYERFGQPGFGVYSGYDAQRLGEHYAPFVAQPNATLPFVYKG